MATSNHRSFALEKWFLDFITPDGEAYIFYAAKLKWGRITIPYKSLLYCSKTGERKTRTRFLHVRFPEQKEKLISWKDRALKTEGNWLANASPLHAELYTSTDGKLQWNCFQPSSLVKAKIDKKDLDGKGYAEQLLLTAEPWKIPMDELRWGRYVAGEDSLVWIEIKEKKIRQWVWYNGERMADAEITDKEIKIPGRKIRLALEKSRSIGKPNTIFKVLEKLMYVLPGFKKSVTKKFLMAKENKWVSKGSLYRDGLLSGEGGAIHEWVDFRN